MAPAGVTELWRPRPRLGQKLQRQQGSSRRLPGDPVPAFPVLPASVSVPVTASPSPSCEDPAVTLRAPEMPEPARQTPGFGKAPPRPPRLAGARLPTQKPRAARHSPLLSPVRFCSHQALVFVCFRCISSELDRKRSSRDLNQRSGDAGVTGGGFNH